MTGHSGKRSGSAAWSRGAVTARPFSLRPATRWSQGSGCLPASLLLGPVPSRPRPLWGSRPGGLSLDQGRRTKMGDVLFFLPLTLYRGTTALSFPAVASTAVGRLRKGCPVPSLQTGLPGSIALILSASPSHASHHCPLPRPTCIQRCRGQCPTDVLTSQ